MDEKGKVIQNQVRLVTQGCSQQERVNYDETFARMVSLESIHIILAFAIYNHFKLFKMDVKNALLNDVIKEEVFVKQTPDFENSSCHDYVFKLSKALYVLKQAPKAWYERLNTSLIKNDFQ